MSIFPAILTPLAESELPAVGRMIALAFGGELPGATQWVKDHASEVRVVHDADGAPASCFLGIPMGQFFGGRSVPMLGIAGVAVPPERRGQGLARSMMQACVLEARKRAYALSALYASTQALYRQVGYEQAGHRMIWKLPVAHIDVRDRSPALAQLTDADDPAVAACYKRFARRTHGMLDRGTYIWNRVKKWRDTRYDGFAIRREGAAADRSIGGYIFLSQKRKDNGRVDIVIQDLAFDEPAMGRRLLGFLADFGSMADEVHLAGGVWHPLLPMMSQMRYTASFKEYWMLRIVNLRAAIAKRGWPAGVRVRCRLNVTDSLIADNDGSWLFSLDNGKASVERLDAPAAARKGKARASRAARDARGLPAITCDIRSIAPLYTGFASPHELAAAGMIAADVRACDTLAPAFAGASPWTTDFF